MRNVQKIASPATAAAGGAVARRQRLCSEAAPAALRSPAASAQLVMATAPRARARSSLRNVQTNASPETAGSGDGAAVPRPGLRFRSARPFAELFVRPCRLPPPSAQKHIAHQESRMEIRKNMQGRERWSGYLSLLSRFETAAIVQPQLAEYGQPKPRRFFVVCAIHVGLKAAAAAQAAGDGLPGRGRYPVRHRPLSATFGLNIPDDLNGNVLDLLLFSINTFVQIGKNYERLDRGWPFRCGSSLEVLDQLLFPFTEVDVQNICLNYVLERPTIELLI